MGGRAGTGIVLLAATLCTGAWAQTPAPSASTLPAPGVSASAPARPSATAAPMAPVPSTFAAPVPSTFAAPAAAASSSARPFGPGLPVTLGCDKHFAYGFIAKGAIDTRPSYPDPFVKVGRLPLIVELPPGVYTLIVEGDEVTSGSTVFEVRSAPVTVKVSAGKSALRSFSSWTLAFGIAAVLAAGVLEVSGGGKQDSRQKNAFAIPLFIAGGVAAVSGISMFVASRTTFKSDGFVPGKGAWGPDGTIWGISGRF